MQSPSSAARTRRPAAARGNGFTSGSISDSRTRIDDCGGAARDHGEEGFRRLRARQIDTSPDAAAALQRKRKIWRPPEPIGAVRSPGQLPPRSPPPPTSVLDNGGGGGERGVENVEVEEGDDEATFDRELTAVSAAAAEEEEEEQVPEEENMGIEVEEAARKSFDDKEMDLGTAKKHGNAIEDDDAPAAPLAAKVQEIPISEYIAVKPRFRLSPPAELEEAEEEEERCILVTQNRMQSIVNLIMWVDVPRSAFVFGAGAFFFISSSFVKDRNFSFISAISYLGLVYLALIFFYKSILLRGAGDAEEFSEPAKCSFIVGEKEAAWLLKILLPYINEILLKVRALFSGDPATTMKVAVILFVMARCGSTISIWTLTKILFFGVFTIPKVCSSYSAQLARYGKFWLERLRDGWESCTHKKAAAAAIFAFSWNLFTVPARIWTVFMLVVALKYYQQRRRVYVEPPEVAAASGGEEVSRAAARGGQVVGPVRHRHRPPPTATVRPAVKKKL